MRGYTLGFPTGTIHAAALLLFGSIAFGCATYDVGVRTGSRTPSSGTVVYETVPPRTTLGIPPGHLPPPGDCRIWFPGQPPGQQPPPVHCGDAYAGVPPGAWLIERPRHDPENVYVNVYEHRRRSTRVEVHIYNADTGVYVGARIP